MHDPGAQRILDALDMCQERIEAEAVGSVDPTVKRGRGQDKSRICVAELQTYMDICDYLAIGHRFGSQDDLKQYIPSKNIKVIFNLRDHDGDKGMWYKSVAMTLGVKQVVHIPMETIVDKDRTQVGDEIILTTARKVAAWMRTLRDAYEKEDNTRRHRRKPVVYIHGYASAHLATVVALIAWYVYMDDNRFNPRKALEDRYDEEIVYNYPEHWFHQEQITRICNRERKSVYAAMKRGGMAVTHCTPGSKKSNIRGETQSNILHMYFKKPT